MNVRHNQQTGGFHWNAGGWFGSQFGMTAWILVTVIVLYPVDIKIAAIVLLLFVAPNAIGGWLWMRRAQLSPYKAVQVLVLIAGTSSIGVVYVVASSGNWPVIQQYGGSMSARSTYLLILTLIVGLMLLFYYLNRQNTGSELE